MVKSKGEKESIELTVLGSGTCVPQKHRGSPGFFLKIGKTKILLDCGPGTVRQLVKVGKDYKDIDIVIISHLHVDHAGDITGLLFSLNNTPGFKRTKELLFLGGEGFKEFFTKLITVFPEAAPKPSAYKIQIAKLKKFELNDFIIETAKGNHHQSSIVIKISAFDKKIIYTGDTDYMEEISKFSKGVDLLITECSYPDERNAEGHLTPRLAGKIASEASAKSLLLTHFYPQMDDRDIRAIVKKYFLGKVILASDFIELKI